MIDSNPEVITRLAWIGKNYGERVAQFCEKELEKIDANQLTPDFWVELWERALDEANPQELAENLKMAEQPFTS